MTENYGTPEIGQLPGSGTEVIERQVVSKEQAAQSVRSWIMQIEMRVVLRRMTKGAASMILDSANSREKRA